MKDKYITINIKQESTFEEIYNCVQDLHITGFEDEESYFKYTLLELIFNSQQAQDRVNSVSPIEVQITIEEDKLSASLTDHGGGFDPHSVEKTGSGLGLIIAKKIASDFTITFLNSTRMPVPHDNDDVEGTRIRFCIKKKGRPPTAR